MFMGILATPLQQIEAATRGALCKKMFLKISQNSQENTCAFIKKETLAQVFSCEFCQISKNNFSQNTSGRLLLNKLIWGKTLSPFFPVDKDFKDRKYICHGTQILNKTILKIFLKYFWNFHISTF